MNGAALVSLILKITPYRTTLALTMDVAYISRIQKTTAYPTIYAVTITAYPTIYSTMKELASACFIQIITLYQTMLALTMI